MKKLLISLFSLCIVAAVAWGLYLYFLTPEVTVCFRVAQLCEIEDQGLLDSCESSLSDLDPEVVRKAAECAAKASSCSEAAGCAVGLGLKTGAGALDRALKSVEDVLSD